MSFSHFPSISVVGSLVLVLGCACSSSPPEEPKTAPAQPVAATAPASNAEVKKGMTAIEGGRFEEAERTLRGARESHPKDPQAAYYHGLSLEKLGAIAEAEAAYESALELDPGLLEASKNLSALLVENDEAERAVTVADHGLERAPNNPGLLANRALALGALGASEAPAAFRLALEKSPDAGWLRYYYAAVLALREERKSALQELTRISIGSDVELAIKAAELYGVLEDFDGCVRVLTQIVDSDPRAELLVRRGRCQVGRRQMQEAERDFRAAVAQAPADPMGHFYLGKHLMAQGDRVEGKKALETAIQLGPETPFGLQAKKALASK